MGDPQETKKLGWHINCLVIFFWLEKETGDIPILLGMDFIGGIMQLDLTLSVSQINTQKGR